MINTIKKTKIEQLNEELELLTGKYQEYKSTKKRIRFLARFF